MVPKPQRFVSVNEFRPSNLGQIIICISAVFCGKDLFVDDRFEIVGRRKAGNALKLMREGMKAGITQQLRDLRNIHVAVAQQSPSLVNALSLIVIHDSHSGLFLEIAFERSWTHAGHVADILKMKRAIQML